MQVELSLRIPTAADRRKRLRLAARAGAGLAAAVLLVLFAANDAAAADDLGGLVTETIATFEPIVEPVLESAEPMVDPLEEAVAPAEPTVEPVVAPIAEQLPPILEPVAPIDPTDPIGSIDPILDGKLPIVPRLLPPLELPRTDASPGGDRPGSAVPIDDRAPASLDAAMILSSVRSDAESDSAVLDLTAVERALGELASRFELPSLPSGPSLDAGTALTFVAALLIGTSMAIPSGWGTRSLVTRLRPIGLTLSPPVPPG